MSRFLTEKDVVERYGGLTISQLRKWRQRRVGPPYCKLGRSIRYLESDVESWLKKVIALRVMPKNGII